MKKVVVIPTYNEKDSIETLIRRVFEIQPDLEIMVVDDNSPDGTGTIVKSLMREFSQLNILERKGKEGLGKAYVHAFRELMKDSDVVTVIMMDADLSHDPMYIPLLLEKRKDFDVVVGSRYLRGGGILGWEVWRKYLSLCGNKYARLITRLPIRDLTAGFNAISTDILRKADLQNIGSSGYAYIIESKYMLHKAGARMTEIPIIFKNRIHGESKISSHIISEGLMAPWRLIFRRQKKYFMCMICAENTHRFFLKKNTHSIYRCIQCKTLQVYPLPETSEAIYSPDYFSGAKKGFGYVDYDTDKEPMRNVFIEYINRTNHILSKSQKNGKALLDVGAATGYFMDIAREAGFKVSGIDISEEAVLRGKKKGLKIHHGILENFDSKGKVFDVITLLDLIEHVPDPRAVLKKCRELISKNGVLVINTPDSGSFYARILGKKWHLIVPPEHLYYFNRSSLMKLLDEEGFSVVTGTTIGKSFTVKYIVLILGKWLKIGFLLKLANFLKKYPRIGHISLPINLRDNMFIIAKPKHL